MVEIWDARSLCARSESTVATPAPSRRAKEIISSSGRPSPSASTEKPSFSMTTSASLANLLFPSASPASLRSSDPICDILHPGSGRLHDGDQETAVERHRRPLAVSLGPMRFRRPGVSSGRGLTQSGATSPRSSCLSRPVLSPLRRWVSSGRARLRYPSPRSPFPASRQYLR
jgi:hypothetical protein